VRRTVIDHFRQVSRRCEYAVDLGFDQLPGSEHDPGTSSDVRCRVAVLEEALSKFARLENAMDYRLFYDRRIGQKSVQELAQASGLPAVLVRQRIRRSFRRFCDFLESHGYYPLLES
jgi:DNA-directed RNA polymerase specialized sigma24 family protein